MKNIAEQIKELPPELQKEVADFVQFVAKKHARKPTGKLGLGWRGALKDLREKYTSVELSHKALEW